MKLKYLFFLLFFIPLFSFAQKKNTWQLCYKNKEVTNGKIGKIQVVNIDSIKNYSIKVNSLKNYKEWKLSFIVMDTNRTTISTIATTGKSKTFKINKSYFYNENKQKRPIVIYISETPTDIKTAQHIRIAPQVLVKLSMKD